VGRCGVVGSTLASRPTGCGFETQALLLFASYRVSAVSELKSLAQCSLDTASRHESKFILGTRHEFIHINFLIIYI